VDLEAGYIRHLEWHRQVKDPFAWYSYSVWASIGFISFLLLMDSNDDHLIHSFDASNSGRSLAKPLLRAVCYFPEDY
jgi:hypothetical protein